MFRVVCIVDEGIERNGNDDRAVVCRAVVCDGFYEEETKTVLAAVCDGVGGEAFGGKAAEIAVTHFSLLLDLNVTEEIIRSAINEVNTLIVNAQKEDKAYARMASTIAGIYLNGDDYIAFNVGDSKVFRYRPPYIAQLSTDHSLVEDLKELGLDAKPGQEHVITRYLGGQYSTPEIVDGKGKSLDCDVYLVCSDGISDVLSEIDLEELFSQPIPDGELCRKLVDMAIFKGSTDNLSAIIIRRI